MIGGFRTYKTPLGGGEVSVTGRDAAAAAFVFVRRLKLAADDLGGHADSARYTLSTPKGVFESVHDPQRHRRADHQQKARQDEKGQRDRK
jgi:hypothetical protein